MDSSGTYDGEFLGYEATGIAVEFPRTTILRIEDGRFAEGWTVFDAWRILEQINVIEPADG